MSCATANNKQTQPNFDWTNANSFQLKLAATDGKDVIPSMIENAKETTPVKFGWKLKIWFANNQSNY